MLTVHLASASWDLKATPRTATGRSVFQPSGSDRGPGRGRNCWYASCLSNEGGSGLVLGTYPNAVLMLERTSVNYTMNLMWNKKAYLLSARNFPRETLIVRSYWILTFVCLSKKVSGKRNERIFPAPVGASTVLEMGIDRGQTQCPINLLLRTPTEGEGARGLSGDLAQMGCVWFRNAKESSILEPVMIRPVIWRGPSELHLYDFV